ncbi:MAG: zinc-binding dehydrogenase, partial [Desulfosarcina sp.]
YGVDVILDMVGGDYVDRNIQLAAKDARIVSIAFLKGSTVEIDLMPMLLKRLVLTGSTMRARSAEVKAGIAQNLKRVIWPFIENKAIQPRISAVYPLEEVSEAHRLMESGTHVGKIVLTID